MAHFYGSIRGGRGVATRCGTKNSGYDTLAASWEGAVTVKLSYNKELDEDWATVCLSTHKGAGDDICLYRGPVSGRDYKKFKK